ncbi:MAG: 3-hydroxyacyl-CoA dehydrogenase NAD-binding domain-containing protein, partial [Hylemonella sp.]
MKPVYAHIAVVGTGAMGRGIAQIAAQAGSTVLQAAAMTAAQQSIFEQWDKLVEKGRMQTDTVAACKARLKTAASLQDLAACDLVVEAIVERLDVKAALFAELEGIVGANTVLASNTSSLSI